MQVNFQVPALSFHASAYFATCVTKEQSHSYPVNNSKANCGQIEQAYIGRWWCAYASGGPCIFDAMYEIAEKFSQNQLEGKMTTMNAGITLGERESLALLTKCQTHGLLHHKK
jgi:hypothetical protein